VIEHLVAGRQVARVLVELPPDIAGREDRVRLVQPDEIVGVHPHPACTGTAVDQDDPVTRREITTRDSQRIEAGNSCADDDQLRGFFHDGGLVSPVVTSTECGEATANGAITIDGDLRAAPALTAAFEGAGAGQGAD
jgi:hypothetical protein